ncbi:MAG: DUF86 domain-containing protein [Propionibacteriaceae bacterium]|nr:DUF86 domain-containing protein [Propionibacteriaceae bacterium]
MSARGRSWYESDPELEVPKLAADSLLLKLGEAVRRLPEQFLEAQAHDPVWRRAIGMRNRLAHEYLGIDYELVWQVLTVHAPALGRSVEAMLTTLSDVGETGIAAG